MCKVKDLSHIFKSKYLFWLNLSSYICIYFAFQQDLYNMTIYDLAYEMDHEALLNIFMNPTPVIEPRQTDISSSNQITFYTHLRRGGMEKVDANAYELVKFVGYFRR